MSEEGKGGSGWRPGIANGRGEHDEGGGTSRTKARQNQGEEADLHLDGAEPCTKKKKRLGRTVTVSG